MEKVCIGVLGCGKIAMTRHIPEYAANANAHLAGYFDFAPDRAKSMAEKYGGKVYDSVEALLCDVSVDAVSICTANSTHAELAIRAMQACKHVLCEKPMAITEQECLAMCKIAAE